MIIVPDDFPQNVTGHEWMYRTAWTARMYKTAWTYGIAEIYRTAWMYRLFVFIMPAIQLHQ